MKHMVMGTALAFAGPTVAILVDGVLFTPALMADVKTGVDAWTQGDYAKAIAEWRPLANDGDPDAQFNMGQAYKLGRGVPADMAAALDWFRKAALQGHVRAEDNYGLLLFQQNRREEAMPYIRKSADRGEPRAQYILGTALFNGEYATKDWVRAYALMTRAAASGLSQASVSLAQMDKFIPLDQRQQGQALAARMDTDDKSRALTAAELPAKAAKPVSDVTPPAKGPRPIRTTALPPSDKARPAPAKPAPVPVPVPAKAAPALPPPAARGGWRVQLGAFSVEGSAKTLWTSLSHKVAGLSVYQPYLVKDGRITRLQAGPLASSADAEKLCRAVKAAGADCLPRKM